MRECRSFGKRSRVLKTDEVIKKYFLVYEGAETEKIYFDAVRLLHKRIGISPLIELVSISKSFSEENWSNPKKIVDRITQDIIESQTQVITYTTLLNRLMDYFEEINFTSNNRGLSIYVWNKMKNVCINILHVDLDSNVKSIHETCCLLINELKKEFKLNVIVDEISEIVKNSGITYSEGFDKICLIVDRDKDSFVANPENNQYEYVKNMCKDKGYLFCITNPNFEFWLLLHFDDVMNLDFEKLLENPKISRTKRYSESELCKLYPRYKKNCYDGSFFVKKVDIAIKNEKKFCEDVDGLENKIGSNIGKLIELMKKGE